MKKALTILFIILVLVLGIVSLTGCDKKTDKEEMVLNEENSNKVAREVNPESNNLYGELISKYEKALEEYDLDDLDIDQTIEKKYGIKDTTILMHIKRYSEGGAKLTYSYYDIDKNGIDELILGANYAAGIIYSYDKTNKEPKLIFAQSTLERGNLSIYDNGIIMSDGSGGAALHYFEFGKIAANGLSYDQTEAIEEKYDDDGKNVTYSNSETGKKLQYTNLQEIINKYVGEANRIDLEEYAAK